MTWRGVPVTTVAYTIVGLAEVAGLDELARACQGEMKALMSWDLYNQSAGGRAARGLPLAGVPPDCGARRLPLSPLPP